MDHEEWCNGVRWVATPQTRQVPGFVILGRARTRLGIFARWGADRVSWERGLLQARVVACRLCTVAGGSELGVEGRDFVLFLKINNHHEMGLLKIP